MRRDDGRFTSLTTELQGITKERDTLRTQLEGAQRREAERIAATGLAQPADLFDVAGVKLEDLVVDGVVDQTRVTERVGELLKARPGLARPHPVPPLPGPGGQPPMPAGGEGPRTFAGLLREKGVRE
jgi:hypothetical protein